MAWAGYIAEEHPAVAYLLSGTGMAHSKGMQSYLTMMAIRLLELHRVLKPTGSIYLHCDPTASHYLKQLLDAIFGNQHFRNEIVWAYTGPGNVTRQFKRKHDVILFYTNGASSWTFNPDDVRVPYSAETMQRRGRAEGSASIISSTSAEAQERRRGTQEAEQRFGAGKVPEDWWADVPILTNQRERVGYPTQKPLALLERIIAASSNPGDVVLDPFAGCATACVAAEKLDRQWVGIDLSSKAAELVNERLRSEMGDLFHYGFVTSRIDVPQRTDIDSPKDYRTHKHVIYGEQEGHCVGCRTHFEFRHLTVDHIVPRKRGGTGHKDNLQLLCGHCDSVKGDRPMEYLLAQLADAAVLTG